MAVATPARRPVTRHTTVAPVRRPRPQPQGRPRLRVVDDARLAAAHRRRRMRLVVVVAAVGVAGCLFALAAFNAVLVSGQARIDGLQRQVSEAQSEYSRNRLRVAELEAPGRIVQVAQERLGMVPPPGVTYLTPSEAVADEVGRPEDGPATTGDSGRSWAAVKPYLGR